MSDSKLFNTQAAADYIGHSAGTLHNWRVTGDGPVFIKPRKKVFYRKQDLDKWLEANGTSKTTAQARLKHCSS
jgi:predicted site-specific integrase-resolvase